METNIDFKQVISAITIEMLIFILKIISATLVGVAHAQVVIRGILAGEGLLAHPANLAVVCITVLLLVGIGIAEYYFG
ncbi:MAG: hypothetical protein ACYC6L_08360 [Anaerolineae bacterium]